MPSEILGFLGAGLAALFFGSNYVPTKNYPTGDGFSFVWFFSSGVFIVGIFAMFIAKKTIFVYSGLLGGSLWATGNLCVIPVVKTIGLGPGMLLWGSTSLLTGFLTGKIGLFGLQKQSVPHNVMNWMSMVFVVLSMVVFFFIKPTLDNNKHQKYDKLDEEKARIMTKGGIQDEPVESSWVDRISPPYRNVLGALLAIGSGVLYGVNMVPMMLWAQDQVDPQPLEFVFSHFTGIYLYCTVIFVVYCIYKSFYLGLSPQIFPEAVLPGMISGAMWGIAQCGLMSATQILGYTVGFPIGSAGPIIVSSCWSVFYFREIRGAKNLSLLGLSFALLFIGIILLALSKEDKKF